MAGKEQLSISNVERGRRKGCWELDDRDFFESDWAPLLTNESSGRWRSLGGAHVPEHQGFLEPV